MRSILPTVVDTRYNAILSQERGLAKAIAKKVVKLPDVTVWVFMIPLIFIINILKYKRAKEAFTLNLLFTKKLAVDAALSVVKKGQSQQEAVAQIEEKTSDILASDKKGIYSEKIRQKQMYEMNLLLSHYIKLLEAAGKSYESLVINAYQSKEIYQGFLRELASAEKTVNRIALQAVGRTKEAQEMISGMEEAAASLRAEQVDEIFV